MSSVTKTIVATGASSGLGFEAVKQLLLQPQPAYRFILGARDTVTTQAAYDALPFDRATHQLTILPLELGDMRSVKNFAQKTLEALGSNDLEYLVLNAAITTPAAKSVAGGRTGQWCESYVVNHLSQHYLVHLLREKLVKSDKARVVVVSSGAVRMVKDPTVLAANLKAGSASEATYPETKFVQLLGAHWWRRQFQLAGNANVEVVAVSPGLIPETGITRGSGMVFPSNLPDAKSVPEGAASILAALTRTDLPAESDRIFLTSWGEWWPTSEYALTLDKELQDRWAPTLEEIESEWPELKAQTYNTSA
ncbi:hypothetical protein FB45DRAFT_364608 [Roridomyces roridus]|uniref:Uncharacterized protein n=1 Tax=Roridomyces roridus TaxID=1738132 RepID=A0AAD7C993_9AGAR|nr:hypothetical protein FB45DRAFT_364608 [Roridomyces roridus]